MTYGYLRLGEGHYRERFGLAFEDFRAGQVFHHRPGVTFTQQDNKDEALDSLNNAHLHYDEGYAAATEWKLPLGVSTLTLQLVIGMTSRTFYRRRSLTGFDEIAMTRPVVGGDTLYARTEVLEVADGGDPDWGLLKLRTEAVNQHGEVAARITWPAEIWRAGRHPEEILPGAATEIAAENRFAAHHPGPDGALVEQTGLHFEDFRPGETFEHWPPRVMAAEESRRHALRALEINPRYSDPAFAQAVTGAEPPLFEPLVVGAVTALTTRTFGRVVANLGWTEIRLPRPVRPGEQIRAMSTVQGARESAKRPAQGILQVDTEALGEDGTTVCAFKRVLLVYKRGQGPYEAAGY
ncbi:MaoC/PaaZ C-terminal domain-containing protein [Marinibaculum pumilum]|uniref:MaoC/PaaZ C-terminal domain-containing protein n=1 Tax=Marinibaculum pumilum TaxID=1766165 RepID=A0ABV7L3K9_9PROT